jgi:hypothetical protein
MPPPHPNGVDVDFPLLGKMSTEFSVGNEGKQMPREIASDYHKIYHQSFFIFSIEHGA